MTTNGTKESYNGYTIHGDYVCFWQGPFSNFAWAPFKVICPDNVTHQFYSSEQYFMWCKALYFKDFETLNKIEELPWDDECSYNSKQLGKQVKNFNEEAWSKVSYNIMFTGCLEKFAQNKVLYDLITSPEFVGKRFVEASPYDRIWGVGLGECDELIGDEKNWQGKNWLGKVLDEVRGTLLNGYKATIVYWYD